MSYHGLVGDTLRAVGCTMRLRGVPVEAVAPSVAAACSTRVKPLQAALLFTQRTARRKPPCF